MLERILASIILILGCIPTFLYFKQNDKGIPFLPLFGLIYSIYYGLPIFFLEDFGVFKQIYVPQAAVEKALERVPGLVKVVVNLATEKAFVKYDPKITSIVDLREAVRSQGYDVADEEEVQLVLDHYGIARSQLPRIYRDDAAVKVLGAKTAQVIRIQRDSDTAGLSYYYRLIVDPGR